MARALEMRGAAHGGYARTPRSGVNASTFLGISPWQAPLACKSPIGVQCLRISKDFNLGKRFGKYRIDQKIAVGGMAEIYKAHTTFGHPVAIKKIHPNLAVQQKFVQMFLDEARIVINLRHPNIVPMYDFGKIDSTYFFSMEWVDGKPLSEISSKQTHLKVPFPIDVALLLIIDVCEGLHYAHEKNDRFNRPLGIVHRDISPPNIMVGRNGIAKVMDFGIAYVHDKSTKTQPGIIRGKFSYMSPEQSRGEDLDLRSDIFSMAIVLYELLTSTRLFLRDSEPETIEAVRKCRIPTIRGKRKDVSGNLERVIKKCLASNAHNRFLTAKELSNELQKILIQEYPDSGKQNIVNFLKSIFPEEDFFNVETPAEVRLGRNRIREELENQPTWVDLVVTHPFVVALLLGTACILLVEIIIRST